MPSSPFVSLTKVNSSRNFEQWRILYTLVKMIYMKKNLILYLFLLLVISNSCTKNDNPTQIAGKVKSYSFTLDTSSPSYFLTTFNYDNNGRVMNVISTNASGRQVGKTTYSYTSSRIVIEGLDSSNQVQTRQVYVLNTIGLVDSVLSYSSPSNMDSISVTTYTYNSNNEAIKSKNYTLYSNGQTSQNWSEGNYTYSNGNMVKYIYSNSNQQIGIIVNYEHYTTINNLTPEAFGLPYSLNQSTNLIKRAVGSQPQQPSFFSNSDYTYTFDGNGRVSSQTTNSTQSNLPDPPSNHTITIYYTYY